MHETRQRNAELALINSVQEAIAGELDPQAIYELVGDKIREVFEAQVVDIGIFDFEAQLTRYPYAIERGVRFPDDPSPLYSPTNRALLEAKAPVLINDVPAWEAERGDPLPASAGEPALSVLNAPLVSGDEVTADLAAEPRSEGRVLGERRPLADDARRQPQRCARDAVSYTRQGSETPSSR